MKNLQKRIGNCILWMRGHKLAVIAGALGIAVIILIVCLVSCRTSGPVPAPAYTGSGLLLEDEYWKVNELGFKYYDREGYTNVFGIDISEWVEDIDFNAVKAAGVDYVILRVGYRGYETGKFVLDNHLSKYLLYASRAGLKIGVYFVSQAVNAQEAVEEAEYVLDHIRGYRLEMPVFIDLEEVYDTARTDGLTVQERTNIVQAFCSDLESQGFSAGVYANEAWFREKLDLDKLLEQNYCIWLAKYSDASGVDFPINMWQFTNEGVIPGTDMWVDFNVTVLKDQEADIATQEETSAAAEEETLAAAVSETSSDTVSDKETSSDTEKAIK